METRIERLACSIMCDMLPSASRCLANRGVISGIECHFWNTLGEN